VFSGRFDHSIDDKGRVSIPARFREVLQRDQFESLVITNFFSMRERCLLLYTPNEWQRMVGTLRQKPSFDTDMQQFQTFFIGGAHEVQVDRQGRILIPPKLRDFAGLERDVTFSAMVDHFQLWSALTLAKILKAAEQRMKDPKFMERINL
jgi:MraZ protein